MFQLRAPRVWRNKPFWYRLEVYKCEKCNDIHFFKPIVCKKCKSKEFSIERLPEEGVVVSYTVVRSSPHPFQDNTPYIVALVRLSNGKLILTQLTDIEPDEISEGMKVEVTFRRAREDSDDKIIAYGFKFKPSIS